MKIIEWVTALLLVMIGLCCMAVSGTFFMDPHSIMPYIHTLLGLCLWIGIPILFVGMIFLLITRKRGHKK